MIRWHMALRAIFFCYPHPRTCLLILERGERGERERERKRERNINVREKHQCERETSIRCPDWELNLRPLSLQDDAPTNWDAPDRARQAIFIQVTADAGWLQHCHFSEMAHDYTLLKNYKTQMLKPKPTRQLLHWSPFGDRKLYFPLYFILS